MNDISIELSPIHGRIHSPRAGDWFSVTARWENLGLVWPYDDVISGVPPHRPPAASHPRQFAAEHSQSHDLIPGLLVSLTPAHVTHLSLPRYPHCRHTLSASPNFIPDRAGYLHPPLLSPGGVAIVSNRWCGSKRPKIRFGCSEGIKHSLEGRLYEL